MQKLKKPVSILLVFMMIVSLFAIVPVTASAAVGDYVAEEDYLTFTAEEAGSTVTLSVASGNNFQYDLNGAGLNEYNPGTKITLENKGDYVRFSGKDTAFNNYYHVSLTGKVACSGNVMSLRLDDNGKSQGLSSYCFQYMFDGCTSLTQAPELPETTLATYCYGAMFAGCTSLTKLPALPATTLATSCYRYMFVGCSNIRISDVAGTFGDITYSAEYRIPTTGTGTSADGALDNMFSSTGGKFTGTPSINTTYYLPAPPTYTVTWKNWNGDILKTDTDVADGTTPTYDGAEPTKAADDTNTYTFSGWNPVVTEVTGDVTYTAQFDATPKHQHDGITFKEWTSNDSLPTVAGNYVLTSNVTLSSTWTVPAGETNLCLAGHTIRQSGTGSVILLDDVSKNLTVYDDGTTGTITGGNTDGNGGGVNITEGTFTLKGGNIEGNVADNGGGVSVYGESSYFIMAGGTVRYNAGYTYTGGVLQIAGHFTMTGGTIQNNVGKVYGGVGIADAPKPSMSGNAVVKDNVIFGDIDITTIDTKITKTASGYTIAPGGTPCDVKHATDLKINVTGALGENACIGITMDNPGVFTDSSNTSYNDPTKFFSNNSDYGVFKNANSQLELKTAYTVTWKNGDTVLKTEKVAKDTIPQYTGETPTKADGECCTYTFHGWNNGLHTYTESETLPAVTEDTTFTAVFTDTPKEGYNKFTVGGHSVYSIVPLGDNVAGGETKPEFIGGSDGENFRLTSLKNCKYNYYSADGTDLGTSFSKGVDGDYSVVVTSDSMPKIVLVKPVYTIKWNNWDDTPISIIGTDVIHGQTPAYDGENPTRADDDANTYTFTGWTPALAPATDNATYTAKFDATPKAFVASVTSNGTTTKYTDFGTAVSNWTDGSTLTLLADVQTSSAINVYTDTKTFDFNGYGIRSDGTDRIFNIAYAGTLTMNDSNPDSVHYITLSNYRGVSVSDTDTETEVVNGNGVVKVNGGYLTGAAFSWGSCICMDNGCHFIMNAGTIIGNTSPNSGAIRMNKTGNFTMNGGQIIYNLGPVGAVNREDYGSSVFEVSGASVIKNNYNSSGNSRNVFVNAGSINKVTGSLKDGAEIGVNMTSGTGVFTNTDSDKINYNDPTKFFSDNARYTVGKNADGQLYLYKSLIAGYSLSLDGNIGINFYLDPSVAGLTAQQVTDDNLSYTFAWADVETTKAKVNVAEQANQKKYSIEKINGVDYIKVTCYVCAAEMTCDVIASFTLGEKTESKTYSVRKYCDTVLKPTAEWLNAYKAKYSDGTAKCYDNLKELVMAMLNYGAMAQTKFKVNTDYLANQNVTYEKDDVTGTMIDTAIAEANDGVADNMNNVAAALGAKWFSTSLIYLDDSTLRHYFVKATDAFKTSDYKANKANYYYYVEVTGIPAAELDNLQSFTAGSQTFKYSALDFVKGMIEYSADEDSVNLAKSLYWYNQAANNYFD